MSDMFLGSQAPFYQNVCITKRTKNGKILEQRFAKNRITKLMLFGIARYLLGHFNDANPDKIYEFIPRYLALGTNIPGPNSTSSGVNTTSNVNDSCLLNEIKVTTNGRTEPVKRICIAERNATKINTKFSDPFIKVSIKTYVSSEIYNGLTIGECGLFSKEEDNNCLARVCFSPIVKNADEVIDIQWDITLLSYGETKYPDDIRIENGSKIAIPLAYTNKVFKEIKLGLKLDGNVSYNIRTADDTYVFKVDDNGKLFVDDTMTFDIFKESITGKQLELNNLDVKYFYELLLDSQFNAKNNMLDYNYNQLYLTQKDTNMPLPFYFGNLYSNNTMNDIKSNEMAMFLLYSEDDNVIKEDTSARLIATDTSGNYFVQLKDGNTDTYRIFQNRWHKSINNTWKELDYWLYNNQMINIYGELTDYVYGNDGIIYKLNNNIELYYTNQYLTYSKNSIPDNKFYIYESNEFKIIQFTKYAIDLINDQKIYKSTLDNQNIYNHEWSLYHLSMDNYWVMSDYVKLISIITPLDSTDKSVIWKILNSDIAKLNDNGVVTSWNLGETTAIAVTSNDLRAKCIVEVVKESKFIAINSINIDPPISILFIDGDMNQYCIVSATIDPLYATNPTVVWTISSEISNCITLKNIGNNKVKIELNGSGNIGTGFIRATSQSGVYAECLVKILYTSDATDEDCPDLSHTEMKLN